jgi:hypothetical protein
MIFKRAVAKLRAQDWAAITIELAIVIIGVFIGIQAANWNQARIEKRETQRLLLELRPALQTFAQFFDTAKPYYATTRSYSNTAFAGWRGDSKVSDEQFVIAAYQASQIYIFRVNGENWAAIFGSDRLRDIDSPEIRRGLASLMTFNYDTIDLPAIATAYREHVRQVIPEDIQDAIRDQCSDKPIGGQLLELYLTPKCDLHFPDGRFASAAADLRARRDLVGELRWHRAAVAAFLINLGVVDQQTRQLQQAIDNGIT